MLYTIKLLSFIIELLWIRYFQEISYEIASKSFYSAFNRMKRNFVSQIILFKIRSRKNVEQMRIIVKRTK